MERVVRFLWVSEPLAGDFPIHDCCFESDDLAEASVGVGCVVEEFIPDEAGVVVERIFGFEEGAEVCGRFGYAGGDIVGLDGLRVEAVTAVVARGFLFAGGAEGSARSGRR